ncbi:MAG: hypothetical protein RR054_00150 [Clostridia bacterium]
MEYIWNGNVKVEKDNRFEIIKQLNNAAIKGTSQLYYETLIDKSNYKERLNPLSSTSFGNIGGNFTIHDDKTLEKLIKDTKTDFMLTATNDLGIVDAAIWVADNDDHFDNFDEHFEVKVGLDEFVKRAFDAQKTKEFVFGREIVVSKNAAINGLASAMMFSVQEILYNNFGIRYFTGEIYRIIGYEDNNGYHNAPMLNQRSFNALTHSGGTHIGSFKKSRKFLEGFNVDYCSEIIIWDYEVCSAISRKYIESKNYTIKINN